MNILGIDTSLSGTSVALRTASGIWHNLECAEEQSHNEKLGALVQDLLKAAARKPEDIGLVVIGEGPGSFTGLRIGYSFVQGFCYAAKIPLCSLSSLAAAAMVHRAKTEILVPMADARRGELFCAVYYARHEGVEALVEPGILTPLELLRQVDATARGRGIPKQNISIVSPEPVAEFADYTRHHPHELGRGLIELYMAQKAPIQRFSLQELALAEPHYVRAVAAKSIEERAQKGSNGA